LSTPSSRRVLAAVLAFVSAVGIYVLGRIGLDVAALLVALAMAGGVLVISAPSVALPPRATDGWLEVAREMARARRHERPFAILRVELESTEAANEAFTTLAANVRIIDHVWQESRAVNVLLAEADGPIAAAFEHRLNAGLVPSGALVAIRPAIFPADGITLGALRQQLEEPVVPDAIEARSHGGALSPATVLERDMTQRAR